MVFVLLFLLLIFQIPTQSDNPNVIIMELVFEDLFNSNLKVMDIGSGTFIFSSAMITSATSRSIISIVKSVGPMLLFGVLRIYFLKLFNYHMHISEYGIHWNFFFTLAAVAFLVNIFGNSKFDFYLGVLCALIHEYLLRFMNFESYLMSDVRISIFDQNKEGIFTILGYLSIYYFGSAFGRLFKSEEMSREEWRRVLIKCWLFLFSSFSFLALYEQHFLFSRRLANFGYIIAVISQSLILVVSSLTLSMFTDPYESLLINVVNSNQFIFFLMGNLSTGLVNISINTLIQPKIVCFLVLYFHSTIIVFLRYIWLNYSKIEF
jgi:glucosaminylphosphatidylinositol acyltransferase